MRPPSPALRLVSEMARHFEKGEGYRFGESTAVSRRVHLVSSQRPGEVDVVTDADAGRVFYHRRYEGQILHLDVFHELGRVDHRSLAQRLVSAAVRYARDHRRPDAGGAGPAGPTLATRRFADYIDIQTSTGGGRVTGGLGYGRGETLRKAHLSHVHLAILAGPRDYASVPYLIMVTEEEIRRQGLEIRRVEKINHVSGQGDSGLDLSDYASLSDSLLREPRRDWSRPRGEGVAGDPSYLRAVLDLADEFGGLDELREILDSLAEAPTWSQLHKQLRNRVPLNQVLSRLEGEGLLAAARGQYTLTEPGADLQDYVVRNRREIELRFKLTLRKLPFCGTPGRKASVPSMATRPGGRGSLSYRRIEPAGSGGWLSSLAIPETVVRAATRRHSEGSGPGFRRRDLLVYRRRGLGPLDICLLIDASASMAGPRMRAAKYLAQHLLLSTRDRVAVIVFQEREAGLYVPFTRNFDAVQRGLGRIRPLGLTPLAEGLMTAMDYVKREKTRDPLLLLITDGIPTVPHWSMNPVADAIAASRLLAKERVRFSCIGLEPNLDFLKDLAATGRGTLHIVDELDQALLSEIAHAERRRVRL